MITPLLKTWFGDFDKDELKKFLVLGFINFLITGSYWSLYTIKDAIFGHLIIGYGTEGKSFYIACTKIVTLLYLIPTITCYSALANRIRKYKLFYVVVSFYAVMLIGWALLFSHPTYGLEHTLASPKNIRGWLWASSIESFSALIFPVFWAFITDISSAQSAKYGFGLIAMIGHLGGIVLPLSVNKLAYWFHTSNIFVIYLGAGFLFLSIILFKIFVTITPKHLLKGYHEAKTTTPSTNDRHTLLEGLQLLLTHKYLLGIFAITGFFQIILTIIDFNFNRMIFECYSCAESARELYCMNGFFVNILTFLSLLFGINNIQRFFGLSLALCLVPCILGFSIIILVLYPELNVIFYSLVAAKVINYSLNVPSIKQLYIPTTQAVKYKSQVWIESFSPNGSKTIASAINMSKDVLGFSLYLTLIFYLGIGIAGFWVLIALFLAKKRHDALEKHDVVC